MDNLSPAKVIEELRSAADSCEAAFKPLDAARFIHAAGAYNHLCTPSEMPGRVALEDLLFREFNRLLDLADGAVGEEVVSEYLDTITDPYSTMKAIADFAMSSVPVYEEFLLALVCKQIVTRAKHYPEKYREGDTAAMDAVIELLKRRMELEDNAAA